MVSLRTLSCGVFALFLQKKKVPSQPFPRQNQDTHDIVLTLSAFPKAEPRQNQDTHDIVNSGRVELERMA